MGQTGNYSNVSELTAAVSSGDQEAFRFLIGKYQDKVIRTSKGFVHSDADAEDIAQEVFIEIYQSISSFRGDSELSTWIYRVTVNKSLNFLKTASRRKIVSFFDLNGSGRQESDKNPAAPPESSPDDGMVRSDQADAVKKALDSLPANQRTAFVLSKYEDLSYREIAEIMKITIPSVESIIFRAKQNLRKRLYRFYKKNML